MLFRDVQTRRCQSGQNMSLEIRASFYTLSIFWKHVENIVLSNLGGWPCSLQIESLKLSTRQIQKGNCSSFCFWYSLQKWVSTFCGKPFCHKFLLSQSGTALRKCMMLMRSAPYVLVCTYLNSTSNSIQRQTS